MEHFKDFAKNICKKLGFNPGYASSITYAKDLKMLGKELYTLNPLTSYLLDRHSDHQVVKEALRTWEDHLEKYGMETPEINEMYWLGVFQKKHSLVMNVSLNRDTIQVGLNYIPIKISVMETLSKYIDKNPTECYNAPSEDINKWLSQYCDNPNDVRKILRDTRLYEYGIYLSKEDSLVLTRRDIEFYNAIKNS